MIFKKTVVAVLATLALGAGSAQAYSFSLGGLPTGQLLNPGSITRTFSSAVADSAAELDFVLNGYRSLDGNNAYRDLFTLTINGNQIGTGSFNLGGGGTSNWTGSGTYVNSNPGTNVTWAGGTTTFSDVTFNLLAGVNTFVFGYSAPGVLNFGGQGLQDEAWGIQSASVTAVPEPETYAMLLAGLGLMGTIARRRNKINAV
jgi:PEP-CTERM motif